MDGAIRELRSEERAWANEVYAGIGFAHSPEAATILVAERDGVRVGLGRLVPIGGNEVELGGIWTAPIARGGGVARAIVGALLARAPDAQEVWCIPYAHLVDFYASCGLALAAPPWPAAVDDKVRGLRAGGVAVDVLRRPPLTACATSDSSRPYTAR
jgi:GNAT superfamily N-acetyltransferase